MAELPEDTTCETDSEQLLKDLAGNYAEYFIVDITKEKKALDEVIEELLTMLDEFISLVDLVRTDNASRMKTLPNIHQKYKLLSQHFPQIDKLEKFVEMVKQNLDQLESKVSEAERELNPSSPLSKLFKPLFSKKPEPQRQFSAYEEIKVFSTDDYFST